MGKSQPIKARMLVLMTLVFLIASTIVPVFSTAGSNQYTNGTRAAPDIQIIAPQGLTGLPTEALEYTFKVINNVSMADSLSFSTRSENGWDSFVSFPVSPAQFQAGQSMNVTVMVVIPAGANASLMDRLNLTVGSSNSEGTVTNHTTTTVEAGYVVDLEVVGGVDKVANRLVGQGSPAIFTLDVINFGNQLVNLDLKTLGSNNNWSISQASAQVSVQRTSTGSEPSSTQVIIDLGAPLAATPGEMAYILVWLERPADSYYSWEHGVENLTLNGVFNASFDSSIEIGNGLNAIRSMSHLNTTWPLTILNSAQVDLDYVLHLEASNTLNITLNGVRTKNAMGRILPSSSQVVELQVERPGQEFRAGNYSIKVWINHTLTGESLAQMELSFIVRPQINITQFTIAPEHPGAGQEITVEVTLENTELLEARNLTILYFENGNEVTAHDISLIPSGSSHTDQHSWTPSEQGDVEVSIQVRMEGTDNYGELGDMNILGERSLTLSSADDWTPWIFAGYIVLIIILLFAVTSAYMNKRKDRVGQIDEDKDIENFINSSGHHGTGSHDSLEPPKPMDGDGKSQTHLHEDDFKAVPLDIEIEPPKDPFAEAMSSMDIEPPEDLEAPNPFEELPPPPPKSFEELTPTPKPTSHIAVASSPEWEKARDVLDQKERELAKVRGKGVNIDSMNDLMGKARSSLERGDLDRVNNYLHYVQERLSTTITRHDQAKLTIKNANEAVLKVKGNVDTSIVQNFMLRADTLFKKGEYREAQSYARKALERAKKIQKGNNGNKKKRL